MHEFHSRLNLVSLAVLLIVSTSGAASPPASPEKTQEPTPERQEGRERGVAMLNRVVDNARQELQEPGACPWDTQFQAAALGYDIQRTFSFVRDEIRYEPYRGTLRGAGGTLSSRSGNALDKSLLLLSMLQAGGHDARLMRGKLSRQKSEALIRQFLAEDPLKGVLRNSLPSPVLDEREIRRFAERLDADPAQWRGKADRIAREAGEFWTSVRSVTDREVDALASWLDAEKIAIGRSCEEWIRILADRATAHTWVQVRKSPQANAWMDLDPAFRSSKPGECHGEGGAPAAVAREDRYAVGFKVIYRRAIDDQEKEESILEIAWPTDEAPVRFAKLAICPADETFPRLSSALKTPPQELPGLLKKIKTYQAVLRSGPKTFASRPFNLEGDLFDVSGDGRFKAEAGFGKTARDLFGTPLEGQEAKKPKTKFLELSVLISIETPAEGVRRQHRSLLTAEEMKADHDVIPLIGWEMLIQAQPVSPAMAAYQWKSHLVRAYGRMREGLTRGTFRPEEIDEMGSTPPEPYSGVLAQFALLRQANMAELLRTRTDVTAVWGTPQVSILEDRFCMKKGASEVCGRTTMDLVDNSTEFIPREAAAQSRAPRMGMDQGIFETASEALLLQRLSPTPEMRSAIAILERARIAGIALGYARSKDPDALGKLAITPQDRKWIQDFEAEGRLIVAPGESSGSPAKESGWWSLDPSTGTVLGRSSGGRGMAASGCSPVESESPRTGEASAAPAGQAAVEYLKVAAAVLGIGRCFLRAFTGKNTRPGYDFTVLRVWFCWIAGNMAIFFPLGMTLNFFLAFAGVMVGIEQVFGDALDRIK